MAHEKTGAKPRARVVGVHDFALPARPSLAHADATIGNARAAALAATRAGKAGSGTAAAPKLTKADILAYGDGDTLPILLREAVSTSPTAALCKGKLAQFTFADGFTDEASAKLQVNPDQTADDLLDEISSYAAGTDGAFALRVKYARDGSTGEVWNVPVAWVRKLTGVWAGKFLVNRHLGTKKFKLDDSEILDAYDPLTGQQVANRTADDGKPVPQPGQLLYVHARRDGQEDYPVPLWWAAEADIRAEGELALFDLDQVRNGFLPTAILTYIGQMTEDEREEFDKQLTGFTGKGRDKKDGRSSLLVLEADNKDSVPDLQTFDATALLKVLDGKRDEKGRAVCRAMAVPPVLAGFATEGKLGATEELVNTMKLFQTTINRIQSGIQRAFEKLWTGKPWAVSTLALWSYLPPEVWAVLTTEEKRTLGGYDATPETTVTRFAALPTVLQQAVAGQMSSKQLLELVGLAPETTTAAAA